MGGCAPCHQPRAADYRERLGVPLRWWVQGTMLVASLWLAVVVAVPGPVAWPVTAVAMLLLGAGLLAYGGVRLDVADGVFRAGRAHIEGRAPRRGRGARRRADPADRRVRRPTRAPTWCCGPT